MKKWIIVLVIVGFAAYCLYAQPGPIQPVITNLTQFKNQTNWRIFYSDGSGDVQELAMGANTEVLTSTGTTSAPGWGAAGAGDITQVWNDASGDVATPTIEDGEYLDGGTATVDAAGEGILLPRGADVSAATAEGQISWDSDNDLLYVGDGAAVVSIAGSFDSTAVDATTWSDGANASNAWTFDVSGTDHTMTAGNGLMTFGDAVTVTDTLTTSAGINLGTSQSIIGTTAMTFGNNGQTIAINSSDWDISTTGVATNMGNITSDGTVEGATITEGGNAVYSSGEIPGGELGGTFASFTIDDSVAVTNWNLTTPTFTTTALLVGILQDNDDMVFEADADNDGSNKFSFTDGAAAEIASITEAGLLSVTVGIDAIGNVDMDYGSADVDDHTFITDGTGTAEIVLPAGSIDGTEILDDTVDSDDYAANSIDDEHLNTTEFLVLKIQSAKLTGNFVTDGDASQGATIDAGEGGWRLLFDATTDEAALWQFRMPSTYGSGLTAKILYTMASGTANEVEFEIDIMAVSDGDSADIVTPSFDTENVGSVTVPGTAGYLDAVSITCTNADSVAAGDMVWVVLSTDANDGINDDATGDREVVGLTLEWTR